jgi:hypothetical protein
LGGGRRRAQRAGEALDEFEDLVVLFGLPILEAAWIASQRVG